MLSLENRTEDRKKIAAYVFVSDLNEKFEIKCVLRDASNHGCLLISSEIERLPQYVHITPEGFDKPICGKVMWKKERQAGVKFVKEKKSPSQAVVDMLLDMPETDDEDDVLLLTEELQPRTFEQRMQNQNQKKSD